MIKRHLNGIFSIKFCGTHLRTIVYICGRVVAKLLLKHVFMFLLLFSIRMRKNNVVHFLLIGLLMNKASVKTSLFRIWWIEYIKFSVIFTKLEQSFMLELENMFSKFKMLGLSSGISLQKQSSSIWMTSATEYNENFPVSLQGPEQPSEIHLVPLLHISEWSIKNISSCYMSINLAWFYSLLSSKASFFSCQINKRW